MSEQVTPKQIFPSVLLYLIVIVAVVNFRFLISPSLSSFYAYAIAGSLFICYMVISVLATTANNTVILTWSELAFLAWMFYVAINCAFLREGWDSYHSYIIISVLLFVSAKLLFKTHKFPVIKVLKMFFVVSFCESIICLFQNFKIIGSYNRLFPVTGTWGNPNVTAMFLAMAEPAVIGIFFYVKAKAKGIVIIAQLANIIALYLLNCRTAWVGTIVVAAVYLQLQFDIVRKFKDNFSLQLKIVSLFVGSSILLFFGLHAYNVKKDSADSRVFIWGIACQMINKNPSSGYGYGKFERDYNISQATFFNSGKATVKEIVQAGHVKMCYNEFLQNFVEGGWPGFIFFSLSVVSLLILPLIKREVNRHRQAKPEERLMKAVAYSGIVCFVSMSLVNFTLQALPVMFCFVVYASVLITVTSGLPAIVVPVKFDKAFYYFVLFSAFMLLKMLVGQAAALSDLKNAAECVKKREYEKAVSIIEPLGQELDNSESYWSNYSYVLMLQGRYSEALVKLQNAKRLSSDPALFMQSGFCYENIGQLNQACKEFDTARCIAPSHFKPQYAFMKTCLALNDTSAALAAAKTVRLIQPKNNSPEIELIKKYACAIEDRFQNKSQIKK
jgi:O-antigen ligase